MTDYIEANHLIDYDEDTHTYMVIAADGFGVQVQARTQLGTVMELIDQLRHGTLRSGIQAVVSTYQPETVQ